MEALTLDPFLLILGGLSLALFVVSTLLDRRRIVDDMQRLRTRRARAAASLNPHSNEVP